MNKLVPQHPLIDLVQRSIRYPETARSMGTFGDFPDFPPTTRAAEEQHGLHACCLNLSPRAKLINGFNPDEPKEDVETDMETQVYTHARWRVKAGNEEAFIEAWLALSEAFSNLDQPPLWGTLLRSADEPNVFYSFGPWRSAKDVERMRQSETAQAALSEVRQLCEEATPGLYHMVQHIEVKRK